MITRNDVYQAFAAYGFETAGSVCLGSFQGYALSLQPNGSSGYYLDAATRTPLPFAKMNTKLSFSG
jgi:hypothetical protein